MLQTLGINTGGDRIDEQVATGTLSIAGPNGLLVGKFHEGEKIIVPGIVDEGSDVPGTVQRKAVVFDMPIVDVHNLQASFPLDPVDRPHQVGPFAAVLPIGKPLPAFARKSFILRVVAIGKDIDIGGVRHPFRVEQKVAIQRIDALWFPVVSFCPGDSIAGSKAIETDTVRSFFLGRKPKGKHHIFLEPWVEHNRTIGFQGRRVISEFVRQFNDRLVSTVVFNRLAKGAMQVAPALDQIVVDE